MDSSATDASGYAARGVWCDGEHHVGMTPNSAAQDLADALNPLLERAGFAQAQYSFGVDGSIGLTFCAAYVEFRQRFPELPQANDSHSTCIDLMINLDADSHVRRFQLESVSVEETLRQTDHADNAVSAASTIGDTSAEALARLSQALTCLFEDQSG